MVQWFRGSRDPRVQGYRGSRGLTVQGSGCSMGSRDPWVPGFQCSRGPGVLVSVQGSTSRCPGVQKSRGLAVQWVHVFHVLNGFRSSRVKGFRGPAFRDLGVEV